MGRTNRLVIVFAILVLGLIQPFTSSAEVHTGIGVLVPLGTPAGWDFSAQVSVPEFEADLILVVVVDPPPVRDIIGTRNGSVFTIVLELYEDVTEAPEDLTQYVYELPAQLSTTYVVFTPEGHYAKFRILNLVLPTIEYAYQDNGSRVLDPGIAVQETTWGRIKAIFE